MVARCSPTHALTMDENLHNVQILVAGGHLNCYNNVVYGLCDQLLLAQRRFYAEDPSSTGLLSQSYRTIFLREAERADARFLWAPQQGGERLVAWTQQVSEYVLSLPNRIGLKYEINPFNALLDYVIANESIPDRPLLYCRRDFDPSPTFVEFLDIARNLNPTGVRSEEHTSELQS